jgi:hypothetical protein
MFNYDRIVRTASAVVGSLILTSVAIGATIAPVSADSTAPANYASAASETAHG